VSDPASVEELPALETISALRLKDGDILVVKLHTTGRLVPEQIRPLMEKSKAAWAEVLKKAGLPRCQVICITDGVDLSVIDVVSQLDSTT
jgi:hypothetical protein